MTTADLQDTILNDRSSVRSVGILLSAVLISKTCQQRRSRWESLYSV